MSPVSLRDPRLDDAERIAEVHVRSWQAGYRDLLPPAFLAGLDPGYRARQYRTSWGHPDHAHVRGRVAEQDGRLAGFVRYGPYRTSHEQGWSAVDSAAGGEVYALYVHPDFWRAGIGGILLETAVTDLLATDLTPVRLWTLRDNTRALEFYRHRGFVPDGASQPIALGQEEKIELPEVRLALSS